MAKSELPQSPRLRIPWRNVVQRTRAGNERQQQTCRQPSESQHWMPVLRSTVGASPSNRGTRINSHLRPPESAWATDYRIYSDIAPDWIYRRGSDFRRWRVACIDCALINRCLRIAHRPANPCRWHIRPGETSGPSSPTIAGGGLAPGRWIHGLR